MDATVEVTSSTQQHQASLSVVTFVGLVHVGVSHEKHLCAKWISFHRHGVGLVERLLTCRRGGESGEVIDLDAGRCPLGDPVVSLRTIEEASRNSTFFSPTNTAREGFRPGLSEILVKPSTLSLSTTPFDQSDGSNTWTSGPTVRTAWLSADEYCKSLVR